MMTQLPRWGLLVALLCLLAPHGAGAQTPEFQPLMTGHLVIAAVWGDGLIYAGLQKGGLVEYDPVADTTRRILTRRDGLGGHYVKDLAWVGGRLWVATGDGGLTSIAAPGTGAESLRVYSSLLPSLDVTAVAGRMVGATERIYYGTGGQGIGEINGGLAGAYYSTLDGLIDDTISALAYAENLLLIATPSGISRFADNTFTNYPFANAAAEAVADLAVGPDGAIWAATGSGVRRWNDTLRTFEHVFGAAPFKGLAVDGQTVWALAATNVYRIEDGVGSLQPIPAVPEGEQVFSEAITAGGGEAWIGGRMRTGGALMAGSIAARAWLAPVGDAAAPHRILPTAQLGVAAGFGGVAFDDRGRPWLGDFGGDGLSGYDDGAWYNITRPATAENDSSGLFNFFGNVLVMARADDAIWFNQAGTGVIRLRPAAEPGGPESWDLIYPGNSGMRGRNFVAIGVHPDGPVFFCTDFNNPALGVDVLIDPDNWRRSDAWIHISTDLLSGNNIWAVGFERRDVVWFGVRDVGLQRWDINGPAAGPDDPLTWTDTSDDQWLAEPLTVVSGTNLQLDAANAILRGRDGSLWVGGNGVVNFRYDALPQRPVLLGAWQAKTQPALPGLLAQTVYGLAQDRNDDLWVLTAAGLNRLRFGAQSVAIDAYTDLATYLSLDPSFYSPSIIVPLAGGSSRHLAVSADGARLVASSDLGGVMVTVPAAVVAPDGLLDAAYVYPNPFPGPAGQAQVSVGGVELGDGGRLAVEVLDLTGQLVYRAGGLGTTSGIWDGRNLQGRRVAGGLYLVKLTLDGRSVVKTLAVAY